MCKNELLYFTDPMCSWCYGFAPEARQLSDRFTDELSFSILMGGLRPGETKPISESMAFEIKGHWEHVQQASGRDFHFDFFKENPDFVYDTGPACRAVVTAWRLSPEKMFDYLEELQRRFYAMGEQPGESACRCAAAKVVGIDEDEFEKTYMDEESERITKNHFGITRKLGVSGFPTIMLRRGDDIHIIARGFMRYDAMATEIEKILSI